MMSNCARCQERYERHSRSNKLCLRCRFDSVKGRPRDYVGVSTWMQAVVKGERFAGFITANKKTELKVKRGYSVYGEAFRMLI